MGRHGNRDKKARWRTGKVDLQRKSATMNLFIAALTFQEWSRDTFDILWSPFIKFLSFVLSPMQAQKQWLSEKRRLFASRSLQMPQDVSSNCHFFCFTFLYHPFLALTPVYKMMRCDTLSSVLIVQRPAAWDRLKFRLAWLAYLWVRTDNFETNWYAILDCWWYLIYAFLSDVLAEVVQM